MAQSSSAQKYNWDEANKILTGSFTEGEQVHLITKNIVVMENGKFTLRPLVTQINITGADETHRDSIFLDFSWKDRKNSVVEQNNRISEAKKKLGVNTDTTVVAAAAAREGTGTGTNVVAGKGTPVEGTPVEGTPVEGTGTDTNAMFGGAGSLDLSSSIRNNNHVGLKYKRSRTARCVEKCMRNSRRKSQRRLRGKK